MRWACAFDHRATQGVRNDGAARAAREANVQLVAGDTKVVPRGRGDKVFAVSSGLGVVAPTVDVGDHRVGAGDVVIDSRTLGDHGAVIMACRHGLQSELASCVAPLHALTLAVLGCDAPVHAMHDPTRGGVATVCHEVAVRARCRIELDEAALPLRRETLAVCELLGLDPLYLACEGRLLLWTPAAHADAVLAVLRELPQGRGAAVIGRVTEGADGGAPLVLRTHSGGARALDLLSGMDLPRIC
ncbi:MAG: AIR synthase-related protein [Planctomycetota bacterium]